MQIIRRLKESNHHTPIERVIFVSIGLLALWFVALMTFMENGKNHAVNIAFVSALILLLVGLARVLPKTKSHGYLMAVAATMIAIVGYFRLNSFFVHTEIIFTLVVIGVSARWGIREGFFSAMLASLSNGVLIAFVENKGLEFEIFVVGGFFMVSAFIVGFLSKQRISALKARTHMSEELNLTYTETLRALVSALDTRDTETGGHSERVTRIALSIADQMQLDPHLAQQLHWGALLHDVGKIGVPDHILRKAGPLTNEEWGIMREHPWIGFRLLEGIPFLKPALDVVLHHHERFDGAGYPDGLAGEKIPLSARIFAVADTFDAITNDRPYRKALSEQEALAEIQRCSLQQFDPQVVEAFLKAWGDGLGTSHHARICENSQPALS
jgi:hypothetical protein